MDQAESWSDAEMQICINAGDAATEAAEEAAADKASAEADTCVWRVTDGQGMEASAAAAASSTRKEASGRLDFVLQACQISTALLVQIDTHIHFSPQVLGMWGCMSRGHTFHVCLLSREFNFCWHVQ